MEEQLIPKKSFYDLNRDGMIFMGCSDPAEWERGLMELWGGMGFKLEWFDKPFTIETSGGRTDLVFPFSEAYFKDDSGQIGRLAMWRVSFGDCSWIFDYKINYAKQHDHSKRRDPVEVERGPIAPIDKVR